MKEDAHTTGNAWAAFAGRFAKGTLTEPEWTHPAHLLVAAWFVHNYPPIEAGVRIRVGIRELNLALGGQNTAERGFHETLTEFWIREVRELLAIHGAGEEGLRRILRTPSNLWKSSYSSDVVNDKRARREWIPPDAQKE
jgi:hypothetical protein